ncbi:MAG: hypothetical protein MRZ48_00225 [Anaerostipes hadrus]|nr:hypothetical protein [Anaerostipes hadrus]
MKGYKAFDKGLICKYKQYKENEVFEEEKAVPCHRGMHFCKNPFDVLNYYDLVDDNGEFSDFAEVEAPDDAEVKTDDNIKYCTTKLKVGAKFSFAGFVKTCVDFVIEKTQTEKPDSGNSAKIGSSGYSAKIGSSGDYAQIGSSGNSAQIGSSGNSAKIGSSGDYAQIGSSGNYAQIGSSGNSAQIGSSGDYAKIGSSWDYAQIGSSGYSAKIGSSGDYAKIGSSGDYAQIGSSGYSAKIKSTGYDSVICCAGDDSCVSAKKGSWITLAEWKYSYEKGMYVPKCVKTEYVDGERIKEDTMYKLIDGEFTEV